MKQYTVTGYDIRGNRLLTTTHKTKASKDIEVEAWRARFKRPEDPAVYCVVTNHNEPFEVQKISS